MIAKKDYDVIVVGAGPAGSCAALDLAKGGVNVALIDKEKLPRHKTCAGGIVRRAVNHIPMDISSVVDRECFTVEFNLLASSLHFGISRDQPIIYMTMRDNFDNLLVSEAQKSGAKILPLCKVFDVHQDSNSIALETGRGTLKADFVVAADGTLSRVAKRGGWQETRKIIPALECQVYVDDETLEVFSKTARFDFDLVPNGYAWVFPKKDHLSIGIGRMGGRSARLLDSLDHYFNLLKIPSSAKLKRHGFVIPVSPRRDGLMKNRLLLVGDAAGLADPITAEGISFAVLSGQIAAKSLICEAFNGELIKDRFNHEMSERILKELKLGRIAGKILYDHPRLRTRLFRGHGDKLIKIMTQIFLGEKTYSEAMKNPLNYLKLLRVWNPKGIRGEV